MKRIGNCYDKILSDDNIFRAMIEAAKGKQRAKDFIEYCLDHPKQIIKRIKDSPHPVGGYVEITKKDGSCGKDRNISIPKFFPDQILHHAILQILNPYFEKYFYKYSCACIKGRGQVYASKYLRKVLKVNPTNTKYFVKLDIRHFYQNIDHDIIKKALRHKIKCKKTLELLDEIIDTKEEGLPLGNYTSQVLANFLLTPLDLYIKQDLHVPYYLRFADDMVLLSGNKRKLAKVVEQIKTYLKDNLGLETHNDEVIYTVAYRNKEGKVIGHNIDFVGYRHFRGWTTVRSKIFLKILRVRRACDRHMTLSLLRTLASLYGYLKNSDSKKIIKKYRLKRYINYIKKLQNRVVVKV